MRTQSTSFKVHGGIQNETDRSKETKRRQTHRCVKDEDRKRNKKGANITECFIEKKKYLQELYWKNSKIA